jgi:hypothetical protein
MRILRVRADFKVLPSFQELLCHECHFGFATKFVDLVLKMFLFETFRVSPHIPAMKFFAFSQATCRTSFFAGIVTPSCLACVHIPGCFFFLRSIHLCSVLQNSIVSNTQNGSDASRKSSYPPVNLNILYRQGAFLLLAI